MRHLTSTGLRMVVGLFVLICGVLVAAYLLPERFLSAAPLRSFLDDPPLFGPRFWKRRCLGISWATQMAPGESMVCAGISVGPRRNYRNLHDAAPWSPPTVPKSLDALAILREMGRGQYTQGSILAWRGHIGGESAIVAGEMASRWVLAWGFRSSDESHRWVQWDMYPDECLGFQEFDHRPTSADVSRFLNASLWSTWNLQAKESHEYFEFWGVNLEGWTWVCGQSESESLRQELERLRNYPLPR